MAHNAKFIEIRSSCSRRLYNTRVNTKENISFTVIAAAECYLRVVNNEVLALFLFQGLLSQEDQYTWLSLVFLFNFDKIRKFLPQR